MNQRSSSSSAQEPSVVLPVVALVAFFVFFPLGFVLSIVSYRKFREETGTTARTLSIVALVLNLLVVPVCGLGVVSAIAVPNFAKFQCRSKQSEAKSNLRALLVAEQGFRVGSVDVVYTAKLEDTDFRPIGKKQRYTYRVVQASRSELLAEAVGIDDMQGDRWTIDQDGKLQNPENRCAR